MPNLTKFEQCIADNLANFGYGAKRTADVLDMYNRKRRVYEQQGTPNAEVLAINDTYLETAYLASETAKGKLKSMQIMADIRERVEQGVGVKTSRLVLDGSLTGGIGVGIVRGLVSMLQADPRFRGGNLEGTTNSLRRKYWALMDDGVDKFGKGTLGRQRGKMHLSNIVRELKGEVTGDAEAAAFAKAYVKLQDTMIDDFNAAGGSMRKIDGFGMPQRQSAAKLAKAGKEKWVKDHLDGGWLDWSKIRRPNGELVPLADRQAVMEGVYDTMRSGGAIDIDDNSLRGTGNSVGNTLEKHRFLVYKNSDAWFKMHEAYGEGSVFDVIEGHISSMARNTAVVQTFGRNPEMFRQMARSIVEKRAAVEARIASQKPKSTAADKQAQEVATGVFNTKFNAMFDIALHRNAADPNSPLAAGMQSTSNILTAAQLGSAALLAVPSDFLNTAMVRFVNNQNLFGTAGVVASYVKNMIPGNYANFEKFMTRSGFVVDEAISGTYAVERFNGVAQYGPALSRRIADTVMRASLLSKHTSVLRGVNIKEAMGSLEDMRDRDFADLPNRNIMERYGITAQNWDDVRKNVPAWSPTRNADFMRPLDILNSDLKNKEELYRKFFTMHDTESRYMVPGSTLEGQAFLRGNARTDTLPGALVHSFAMYKNFPVSMVMTYGRLAMGAGTTRNRRLAFIAGLGLGMTAVGALGVQMRELSRGREPMPMDSFAFAGKAFLAGGALSIWGDFLFSGVNQFGGGVAETLAGPVAGLAGDVADLAFGDVFKWASAADQGKDFESPFAARAVEFAKRYTPGTSLWYARLALEREVWDRMEEWADPKISQKRQRRMRKQEQTYGNGYYSVPGSRLISEQ